MTFDELEERYGVTKYTELGEQLIEILSQYKKYYVSKIEMSYGCKYNKNVKFIVNIDSELYMVNSDYPVSEAREIVETTVLEVVRQVLDQL